MVKNNQYKKFDLEDRTTNFAKRIIRMCNELFKNEINKVFIKQIIRSAGSIGANYREANDALGDKDFLHKMRIDRKETKETLHWLELIEENNLELKHRMQGLKQECREIKNIFSSIINKKQNKKNKDKK